MLLLYDNLQSNLKPKPVLLEMTSGFVTITMPKDMSFGLEAKEPTSITYPETHSDAERQH